MPSLFNYNIGVCCIHTSARGVDNATACNRTFCNIASALIRVWLQRLCIVAM